MYRELRLCAQGGGYEAIPDPPRTLDLHWVRASLEADGIPILDARVLLIASLPPEVTISRSGRLLFKTADPAVARAAFDRLMAFEALAERPRQGVRRDTS